MNHISKTNIYQAFKISNMTKTNLHNISKLYSFLGKTRINPKFLNESDKLTKYIIAKALLTEVQNVNSFEKLIFDLENNPVYRYFSNLSLDPIDESFDELYFNHENDLSDIYFEDEDKHENLEISFAEEISNLNTIYESYIKDDNNISDLINCIKILSEFLDSFDIEFVEEIYKYLKFSKTQSFYERLLELENHGFINIADKNVIPYDFFFEEFFYVEIDLKENLKKLITYFTKNRRARNLLPLGWYYYTENLYESAKKCYSNIIQIANKDDSNLISGAYNNLGYIQFIESNFKNAIKNYEKSIEIKSDYAQPYNNWGHSLAELKKYEEACLKYNQAIKIEPSYVEAYFGLGVALERLGKNIEACSAYESSFKLNPNHAKAYTNLGNVLIKLEKYEEASLNLQKAIEINPKLGGAYYNLARAYERIKYYGEDDEKIIDLYIKSCILLILEKEWRFSYRAAILKIKNRSEKIYRTSIIFFITMGLYQILNPNSKISDRNLKALKNYKKRVEAKNLNKISPSIIVIDALLDNKRPDTNILEEDDSLVVQAAIVLANEIVSKLNQHNSI